MSSDDRVAPLLSDCPLPFRDTSQVLLGHGSGGKLTAELIEKLLVPAFRNDILDRLDDQAILPIGGSRIAFTTDSYVVTPIFFRGGDIGSLAVHGTINDLAMGGARPLYLSLSLILEEGLAMSDLERVVESIRGAAMAAGVQIVTGDTKVVGRGSGDKIFINTAGIGLVPEGIHLSAALVRPGDDIVLSGSIGEHGIAIFSQREGLEFEGEIASDSAPLHGLVGAMLEASPSIHAMRDPTRGGLAATLVEIASRQRLGMDIDESTIPVRDAVRGACETLGFDPMFVANEGKLVAFIPPDATDSVLSAMHAHPLGRDAVRIGRVTEDSRGRVSLRTPIGGRRILDLPFGELLPRIC